MRRARHHFLAGPLPLRSTARRRQIDSVGRSGEDEMGAERASGLRATRVHPREWGFVGTVVGAARAISGQAYMAGVPGRIWASPYPLQIWAGYEE